MEGSGGFLSPGDQGAEASQAVPEPAYAFTLARPAGGAGRGSGGDAVREGDGGWGGNTAEQVQVYDRREMT